MNTKNLKKLISILGGCNDLIMKPENTWPEDIGFSYTLLEEQAAILTEDEMYTFADGDEFEANKLIAQYDILPLHNFLDAIFQGYLHDKFYYDM